MSDNNRRYLKVRAQLEYFYTPYIAVTHHYQVCVLSFNSQNCLTARLDILGVLLKESGQRGGY